MSLNIFWFLPTHGDGKYLGTAQGARAVDHGYLQQIAQAADRLGFGGVLIPVQGLLADKIGILQSYWFTIALLAYILFYALIGSRVSKRLD